MTLLVPTRGNHGDHRARASVLCLVGALPPHPRLGASPQTPLSGRRGALTADVTRSSKQRPVDTIAVARKLAEGPA